MEHEQKKKKLFFMCGAIPRMIWPASAQRESRTNIRLAIKATMMSKYKLFDKGVHSFRYLEYCQHKWSGITS